MHKRENIYKWQDTNGQVHYGQQKPVETTQVEKLDIIYPPPLNSNSNPAQAEISRINALTAQMAKARRALKKEREERTLRRLKIQNEELQNALLNKQLQQESRQESQDQRNGGIYYYSSYPYYPLYPPHCVLPPCRKTIRPVQPISSVKCKSRPAVAKPKPFRPTAVGLSRH